MVLEVVMVPVVAATVVNTVELEGATVEMAVAAVTVVNVVVLERAASSSFDWFEKVNFH